MSTKSSTLKTGKLSAQKATVAANNSDNLDSNSEYNFNYNNGSVKSNRTDSKVHLVHHVFHLAGSVPLHQLFTCLDSRATVNMCPTYSLFVDYVPVSGEKVHMSNGISA